MKNLNYPLIIGIILGLLFWFAVVSAFCLPPELESLLIAYGIDPNTVEPKPMTEFNRARLEAFSREWGQTRMLDHYQIIDGAEGLPRLHDPNNPMPSKPGNWSEIYYHRLIVIDPNGCIVRVQEETVYSEWRPVSQDANGDGIVNYVDFVQAMKGVE